MKFWIIDEVGLKTKEGRELVRGLNVQQIEIPDKVFEKIKKDFEEWLEKEKKRRENES